MMKKNYIVPEIKITKVALEQMLAASNLKIGDDIDNEEEITAEVKHWSGIWDSEW